MGAIYYGRNEFLHVKVLGYETKIGNASLSSSGFIVRGTIMYSDHSSVYVSLGTVKGSVGFDLPNQFGGTIVVSVVSAGFTTGLFEIEAYALGVGVGAEYKNGSVKVTFAWGAGASLSIDIEWLMDQMNPSRIFNIPYA
jgi:hypothetical protein